MTDTEVRKILEEFRDYVLARHNANIGWWNDSYAYRMMETVIKPALAKLSSSISSTESNHGRSETVEEYEDRTGKSAGPLSSTESN